MASIAPCRIINRSPDEDFENIYEEILKEVSFLKDESRTFKAIVRKNDKSISLSSPEIGREIGHRVLNAEVSISSKTRKGIGGFPWGRTGNALTLLSEGFDSPVASFIMMRVRFLPTEIRF